jgi:hypothetical protein
VHISINFGRIGKTLLGFVFGFETATEDHPEGVDVFKMPAALFLRVYAEHAGLDSTSSKVHPDTHGALKKEESSASENGISSLLF